MSFLRVIVSILIKILKILVQLGKKLEKIYKIKDNFIKHFQENKNWYQKLPSNDIEYYINPAYKILTTPKNYTQEAVSLHIQSLEELKRKIEKEINLSFIIVRYHVMCLPLG